MTQLLTPPSTRSPAPESDQSRVLLHGISWDTYSSILKDIGDRAPRLTYNNGSLEIELPGRLHELVKWLIAEMVVSAMRKLGIDYEPSGATTWRKQAELKGLEADECYHIQSIRRVIGKSELDLTRDPPPDLAIEVEVTSPMINKLEVYQGLKIPELWRIKADCSCEMYHLDAAGVYQPIQASVAIRVFTPALVSHFVLLREQHSHNETLRQFEAEVLATLQK